MSYDYEGAIKAGANPSDVMSYMASQVGYDAQGAVGAGAKPDDVMAYMAQKQSASQTPPDTTSGGSAAAAPAKPSGVMQSMSDLGDEISSAKVPTWQAGNGDTPMMAGAKAAVNFLPSLANFALGAVETPVSNILKIPQAAADLTNEQYDNAGSGVNAAADLAESIPSAAYESIVPTVAQGLITASAGKVTGNQDQVDQGMNTATNAMVNDPVGNTLPFVMLGREAAYKVSPEAGAAFDGAISKVGKPVASALSSAVSGPIGIAGKTGRFLTGQATALDPETVQQVIDNPKEFSKQNMETVTRPSVASEIKAALDQREADLSETGKGYGAIRKGGAVVDVNPGDLGSLIKSAAKVTIDSEGNVNTSGSASVRDPGDIRALQNLYDTWQPEFADGKLTADEFLNFRKDLTKLSKFDRELTSSDDLEAASQGMRANLNAKYRSQIPGLEQADKSFADQIGPLNELKQGILDKNGELTDASINRIANGSNKTRTVFNKQLEDISPGITKKIRVLKAVEDIDKASGQKVGTYARTAVEGGGVLGGIMTGDLRLVVAGITAAILASPEVAVPLLRTYGFAKGIVTPVLTLLKSGLNAEIGGKTALSGDQTTKKLGVDGTDQTNAVPLTRNRPLLGPAPISMGATTAEDTSGIDQAGTQAANDYYRNQAIENTPRLPAAGETTKAPIRMFPSQGNQMDYTGADPNVSVPSSRIAGSPYPESEPVQTIISRHLEAAAQEEADPETKAMIDQDPKVYIDQLKEDIVRGLKREATGDYVKEANQIADINTERITNAQQLSAKIQSVLGKKSISIIPRLVQVAGDESTIPDIQMGTRPKARSSLPILNADTMGAPNVQTPTTTSLIPKKK